MSEMIDRVAEAMANADSQADYTTLARTAIEAMREPTEAMLHPDGKEDAGNSDFCMRYFEMHRADDTVGIWRAMIDKVLEE